MHEAYLNFSFIKLLEISQKTNMISMTYYDDKRKIITKKTVIF